MATIRVRCRRCGDQEVKTGDVTVVTVDGVGTYRFRCPKCRRIVIKRCDDRTVELLVGAGVARHVIDLTLESTSAGEPITHDDLIDAHQLWDTPEGFWADFHQAQGSTA